MKHALVILLFALTASAVDAESRVVLTIGHAGAVRDAVAHPTDRVAFSVGDDGRLLVWDLELQALRHRYQISHRPIIRVVHHPNRNQAALVVKEGVDRSSIRVINWETGEQVFRRDLDGVPIHISYSPAGSFLIFSLPTLQSLFFLDADRGTERSYIDDGFGIVSFVQMGPSERNIMTYVPSRGEFIYFNLQTGDELQRVPTRAEMKRLTSIDPVNRRALASAGENELLIVDNLTGETKARYPVSPIHDIRYDQANARIMVLTDQSGRRTMLSFTYQGGRLRRDSYRAAGLSAAAQFVAPMQDLSNVVMAGDGAGRIEIFSDSTGRRTELGPKPTVPVFDVAFTEGRLHLSLGDHILSLVSDAFEATARTVRLSLVRQSVTALPDTDDARLERAGDQVLIWGRSEPGGTIQSLIPPSTTPEPYYVDDRENSILDVRYAVGGPLIVHRDGRVLQLSRTLPVERFRYFARGAQTAIWDPEIGMIVGKTKSNVLDSSLIQVDQLTGETVPIYSDSFLSTDIALGSRSALYVIGLYGSPASAITRLVRYSGSRFEQDAVVAEYSGEDPTARALWDDQTDSLFTTLGFNGLQRIKGREISPLESTGQIARQLALGGIFVAAVNADGSVTLWNRFTGELLVDIYVFENDEWIAMNIRGAFLTSSSEMERYLKFIPERQTRLQLDDFRITLPYSESTDAN